MISVREDWEKYPWKIQMKNNNTIKLFEFDNKFYTFGNKIAGIDEAGRGPLAGPVCAAVCIMPRDKFIDEINDSKKLTETKRLYLYEKIKETALDYSFSFVDNEMIDKINILNATKLAMSVAVRNLKIQPDFILIDAVKNLDIAVKSLSVIKGDALSYSIAAASIIAKVERDNLMREYDKLYPQYNFAKHKGYGTKQHIDAIKEYGATPLHRKTFIKNFIGKNE